MLGGCTFILIPFTAVTGCGFAGSGWVAAGGALLAAVAAAAAGLFTGLGSCFSSSSTES